MWSHCVAPFELLERLSSAAQLLIAQGRQGAAKPLLDELADTPAVRAASNYPRELVQLVRCALAFNDVELARRFLHGFQNTAPICRHSVLTGRALVAEAAGQATDAAGLFAEAAESWREFGNVPERAYALLGQGRCLRNTDPAHADAVLREAQQLFAAMGFQPALAEVGALLGRTGDDQPA